MNNSSIHQTNLDVIALESKHQSDFERSHLQQKFSKNYKEEQGISFEDGKYDGELDLEPLRDDVEQAEMNSAFPSPEPYQWFNPIYRKGYFTDITVRFNELFSA